MNTDPRFRSDEDGESRALPREQLDRLALSTGERWVLGHVRRWGTFRFVAVLTVVIVLLSVAVTTATMWALVVPLPDVIVPALLLSTVIPVLIAPPTLAVTVRLTERLDIVGDLLQLAASTDHLTGVLNRRGFFDAVDDFARSRRGARVAMLDVDQFKTLNDTHGHAVGDLVLQRVAAWLTSIAGQDGIVARTGGDEFAVLTIDRNEILPTRQSLVMDGLSFNVTLGCADYSPDAGIDVALAAADAALYAGKEPGGRETSGREPSGREKGDAAR